MFTVWVTILEHVTSSPFQDFSLMVEIWEILPICPSTQWKPVASETALCPVLFRFLTKHKPFSRTAVSFILTILFLVFRFIVSGCPWTCWRMIMHTLVPWPVYAGFALVHCPTHRVVDDGWPWGWALCVWVWAGVCAWGCGSMCGVSLWFVFFGQLLHLFEYFDALLARLISVNLKFGHIRLFWMCAMYVYLCVIFNIFKTYFCVF